MSFFTESYQALHEAVDLDRLEQSVLAGDVVAFEELQRQYQRMGLPARELFRRLEVGSPAYQNLLTLYNQRKGVAELLLQPAVEFIPDRTTFRAPGRPNGVYWSYELPAFFYEGAWQGLLTQLRRRWEPFINQYYSFVEGLKIVPMGFSGPFGHLRTFSWHVALRGKQPWAYGIEEALKG